MNNGASSRVSWGRFVRAQNLQPERPGVSSPGVEYVDNLKAPLPSAAELRDLDSACPGTADRIVTLLEKQVAAEITQANRRETFGEIRQLLALVAGVILVSFGKEWGAVAFVMTFAELCVGGKIRQAGARQKKIEQVMNAVGFEIDSVNKPTTKHKD